MMETWLDRVKMRASALNMSLEAIATAAKLNRSYFRKTGGRPSASPRGATLERIAKTLSVTPQWILRGGELELDADSFPVPEIEAHAGAGGGGIGRELADGKYRTDAVRRHWGLPAEFLRHEAKVSPKGAHILEVTGDSMFDPSHPTAMGTLLPGDRAIIDTTDKSPSPPGAFALWDGLGVVVKTVEVIHGSDPTRLRLSSRNPAYPPYEINFDEAQIIGRVRARITVF